MEITLEDLKAGKIIGEAAFEYGMFDGYDVSLIRPDGKRESLVTGMNRTLYNYMMDLIVQNILKIRLRSRQNVIILSYFCYYVVFI